MDIETEAVELIAGIVGEDQLEKIHKFVNGYFPTLVISGTAHGSNGCTALCRVLEGICGRSFTIDRYLFMDHIQQPLLERRLREASLIVINDDGYGPTSQALEILRWLRRTFPDLDCPVVIVTRDISANDLNEIGVDESSVIRLPFSFVRNPQLPNESQIRFDWPHTVITDPEFKNNVLRYLNQMYDKRIIKFN